MLNMSDQFYNYLSSKLFDYFKSNPLVNGDRFYIQFDEDSQIVDFYNSIKEYGENNSSLRILHLNMKKEMSLQHSPLIVMVLI